MQGLGAQRRAAVVGVLHDEPNLLVTEPQPQPNPNPIQAKSGMNGGMDFLCGRLVYYDEVSQDFASAAGDRIE